MPTYSSPEESIKSEEANLMVVINHEEQYSLWPIDRELPLGWSDAGKRGTKTECLEYIDQTWTDMRPRSLREKMRSHDA